MLSVFVICKNEAANIARCLQSVAFADEIIVLDSGSTDDTVSIAKQYTPHVFITDWQGYGVQKQRALEKTTGDWVLNLDADECVSQGLRDEIIKAMADTRFDGYRVPIKMAFYGKTLNYSMSPKRHVRLFRREKAQFSQDIVHEKVLLPSDSVIGQLHQPIVHQSFQDVSHAIYKLNKYSSYSAKIRVGTKKAPGMISLALSSTWMFIRCYFLQRGFLDGREGFFFAAYNAQGTFYRGLKQIYHDRDMEKLPEVTR